MCAIRIVAKPSWGVPRLRNMRQQRRAEHDLGRRQRDEDEEVDRRAALELVAHERERRDRCRGSSRRSSRARRSPASSCRASPMPGHPERVLPGLEAELLPDEVEAPGGVVEREDHDDRRSGPAGRSSARPAYAFEEPVEAPARRSPAHRRSPSVPSSASVPAMRAQIEHDDERWTPSG